MSGTSDTQQNTQARWFRLPSPGTLLAFTLLLIVSVVAIPLGLRYQRQRELIQYIEDLGGDD